MRSIFLVKVAQGNSWWYILPVQHVVELCVYIHSMYVMYAYSLIHQNFRIYTCNYVTMYVSGYLLCTFYVKT